MKKFMFMVFVTCSLFLAVCLSSHADNTAFYGTYSLQLTDPGSDSCALMSEPDEAQLIIGNDKSRREQEFTDTLYIYIPESSASAHYYYYHDGYQSSDNITITGNTVVIETSTYISSDYTTIDTTLTLVFSSDLETITISGNITSETYGTVSCDNTISGTGTRVPVDNTVFYGTYSLELTIGSPVCMAAGESEGARLILGNDQSRQAAETEYTLYGYVPESSYYDIFYYTESDGDTVTAEVTVEGNTLVFKTTKVYVNWSLDKTEEQTFTLSFSDDLNTITITGNKDDDADECDGPIYGSAVKISNDITPAGSDDGGDDGGGGCFIFSLF